MKIRMLEFYQGRGDPSLAYGEECEVPSRVSEKLAAWLLEHKKAEVIEEPKHYVAQPLTDEPELAQDEEISAALSEELEKGLAMEDFKEMQEIMDEPVDATDAALKLAEERGVDLTQVEGTGSGGRIILPDVQSYLEAEEDADEPQESDE